MIRFFFVANPPHTHSHTHMVLIPLLSNAGVVHPKSCSALLNTQKHTFTFAECMAAGACRHTVVMRDSSAVTSTSVSLFRKHALDAQGHFPIVRNTSSAMSEAAWKAFCSSQRPSLAVTETIAWSNTCRTIQQADGPPEDASAYVSPILPCSQFILSFIQCKKEKQY